MAVKLSANYLDLIPVSVGSVSGNYFINYFNYNEYGRFSY